MLKLVHNRWIFVQTHFGHTRHVWITETRCMTTTIPLRTPGPHVFGFKASALYIFAHFSFQTSNKTWKSSKISVKQFNPFTVPVKSVFHYSRQTSNMTWKSTKKLSNTLESNGVFTLVDPIPILLPILVRIPWDCKVIRSESDSVIRIAQCECPHCNGFQIKRFGVDTSNAWWPKTGSCKRDRMEIVQCIKYNFPCHC